MKQRIEEELSLIRQHYSEIEVKEHGNITWVKVPAFKLPTGWNVAETPVALNFPAGYPGSSPYGIYFQAGISYNNQPLTGGCQIAPPFDGTWNMVSWTPVDGAWKPENDVVQGSNMLNFLRSFTQRFMEGV